MATLFTEQEAAEARAVSDVVDLFSGPRGWSEGGRLLDPEWHDIGIEYDRWANATARAAGHLAVEADVSTVDPTDYLGARGLIASPPCQAFSAAGTRTGSRHLEQLLEAIDAGAWHARPHPDPNVWLVLEVGRWAEALHPEWIACEQVPAVLPIWERYAEGLGLAGYSTWTGILNAADYGVPQTRRRAVLIASRTHRVEPPPPTHAELAEPPLERWVTMAEALGWGMTERPYYSIAPGTGGGGTDPAALGGSGAREQLYAERDAGRWQLNTGMDWKPGQDRDAAQTLDVETRPAPTLSTKSGGQWHLDAAARQSNPTRRNLDQPAPTLAFGNAAADWIFERPSTTVLGDPRLWPPGHKINQDDRDRLGDEEAEARYGDRAGTEAIRLEIADALVLQSFRRDYPVRGTKTKQFEQIGNAVPPLLAAHILRAATVKSS